jgi:hypothetical protein
MKLVFPGGEHPQVLLGPGVSRIGSDPNATIVLDCPGVMPDHCQLHVTAHGVMLEAPRGTSVSVNGRAVDGLIALRAGDTVSFNSVQAKLSSLEAVAAVRHQAGAPGKVPASANDDPGVTAVRTVLPRYVLRCLSGESFGRSFPLHGVTLVGRAPECAMRLDEAGISRMHARLLPTDEGVQLEDLGSTNGSFINERRVLRGEVRVGDEIGFDALRFRLVASLQNEHAPVEPETQAARAGQAAREWRWIIAGAAVVVAALIAWIVL